MITSPDPINPRRLLHSSLLEYPKSGGKESVSSSNLPLAVQLRYLRIKATGILY